LVFCSSSLRSGRGDSGRTVGYSSLVRSIWTFGSFRRMVDFAILTTSEIFDQVV
jgi:hypothetical protein